MNFKEALEHAKQGDKIKLPSWKGYWEWENNTIMMHCFEKDSDTGKGVLDIRETQRVEYTLMNVASDEWELATSENCELLGGEQKFGFDNAIKLLKRGFKLQRSGWNGKGQYIALAHDIKCDIDGVGEVNPYHDAMGNDAIAFVGTSGVQIGWLASQADMLAEDWRIVNEGGIDISWMQ